MKNEDESLQFMREMAALPMTVAVGGTTYPVALLSPMDLAVAQQFVVDMRCKRYMASATINDLMNPIHAQVLADFHKNPINVGVLAQDPDGCLKICHIALRKAKTYQGSYEELGRELDAQGRSDFVRTLYVASGVLKKPEAGDIPSDPTELTPGTSQPDGDT